MTFVPTPVTLWVDYDGSGIVDSGDLLEWQRQLAQAPSPTFAATRTLAAKTQSPLVNDADLAVWRQYYGQSLPLTTAVPEPPTLVVTLNALTFTGGACMKRERRK